MSEKFCTHIKLDGVRCGCMALAGKRYCHFHERYYDRDLAPKTDQSFEPLPFEDTRSILLTIHQLVRSLLSNNIDRGTYHDAVYGLQVAAQYANRPDALSPEAASKVQDQERDALRMRLELAKLTLTKPKTSSPEPPKNGKLEPEFNLAQLILDSLEARDKGESLLPDIESDKAREQR
jgi:hypothetical protein